MKIQYRLLLVLVLIGVFLIGGCKDKMPVPQEEKLDPSLVYQDYQNFEECINTLKSDKRYSQITPGEILITFDKSVKIDEINVILEEFSLNRSRPWPGTYYHLQNVAVLQGTEYYWLCKFKNMSDKVKGVDFDKALTVHR